MALTVLDSSDQVACLLKGIHCSEVLESTNLLINLFTDGYLANLTTGPSQVYLRVCDTRVVSACENTVPVATGYY